MRSLAVIQFSLRSLLAGMLVTALLGALIHWEANGRVVIEHFPDARTGASRCIACKFRNAEVTREVYDRYDRTEFLRNVEEVAWKADPVAARALLGASVSLSHHDDVLIARLDCRWWVRRHWDWQRFAYSRDLDYSTAVARNGVIDLAFAKSFFQLAGDDEPLSVVIMPQSSAKQ